ncbi:MAG: hypothetical protein P8Y58_04095 [Novosphingobium sp.]
MKRQLKRPRSGRGEVEARLDTSVLIALIFGEPHDVNEDTVLAGGGSVR